MLKYQILAKLFALLPLNGNPIGPALPPSNPELLTFDELVMLSKTDHTADLLEEKLAKLLNTPFLDNDAAREGVMPHREAVEGLGPVVRVAEWNIERG